MKELTVKQYQQFNKLDDTSDKALLESFLSYDKKELNKIPLYVIENELETIKTELNAEPMFFPTFKMDGVEFGFIPNLEKITYGENEDLTEYMADVNTLHRAMAVAYRPITKKLNNQYLIEEYQGSEKYAEVMKNAPLKVALGMGVFFYNLMNDLLNSIPNYLKEEVSQHYSERNGANISALTRSLKVILEDMTRLRNNLYTNAIYI